MLQLLEIKRCINTRSLWMFLYPVLLFLLLLLIQQCWFPDLLAAKNFQEWDSKHYEYIMKNGYVDNFILAFFPLFPFFWKITHLGVIGISILNGGLYLSAFYVLVKNLKITDKYQILLYLSIPSAIFFYLPYTESLFFCASILILIGYKKNNYTMILLGMFVITLTRPVFTVLLPAFVLTELCKGFSFKSMARIALAILIVSIAVFIVAYIQFKDTGIWFKFFEVQKGWNADLRFPKFPLISWGGDFIVKIDALAFLFGTISGILFILNTVSKKYRKLLALDNVHIFCLLYMAGISLLLLIFKGGSLYSLHRFVFATPFVIVLLDYWLTKKVIIGPKTCSIIFLSVFSFWLLFGSYTHIQQILTFGVSTLYFSLFIFLKANLDKYNKVFYLLLIGCNCLIQLILMTVFLSAHWVA